MFLWHNRSDKQLQQARGREGSGSVFHWQPASAASASKLSIIWKLSGHYLNCCSWISKLPVTCAWNTCYFTCNPLVPPTLHFRTFSPFVVLQLKVLIETAHNAHKRDKQCEIRLDSSSKRWKYKSKMSPAKESERERGEWIATVSSIHKSWIYLIIVAAHDQLRLEACENFINLNCNV